MSSDTSAQTNVERPGGDGSRAVFVVYGLLAVVLVAAGILESVQLLWS